MEVRLACAIVACLLSQMIQAQKEIKNCKPPSISKQAKKSIFYQNNGEASLPCTANGDPPLKYTWLKDGQDLDPTSLENQEHMTIVSDVGSLVLKPALEEDNGKYQCKVTNQCGTTLSIVTDLQRAFIEPFRRQDNPENITAFLGKHLVLPCKSPISVPGAVISWILVSENDNEDLGDIDKKMFNNVQTGRRITMDYEGNLYFVTVEQEDNQDGKKYVCMAANNEVRSFNQGEDKILSILGTSPSSQPPALQWHSPIQLMVLESRKARFKCIFSGHPMPQINWSRKDGGPLDEERMKKSGDEHEFIISDVKAEDAGEYECSGSNSLISTVMKKAFTLSVESFPSWTKKPSDQVVGVDDTVKFECDAKASPPVVVEWFINGVPLAEAPPDPKRILSNNGKALQFKELSQDDSKAIQCNVSNVHGYQWEDVYLSVEAERPSIVKKPSEHLKVAQDRDVTITCNVKGKPKPDVLWYKGAQKLGGERFQMQENGDLIIKSVTRDDSGNYMCIAKNRFGDDEAEGSLVVRERTQIMSPPSDDKVTYGESVYFKCAAVTDNQEDERLHIRWMKNGKPINRSDPRITVSTTKDSFLNITNTNSKDSGVYSCNATNDLDSAQAQATLEVAAPPDPPYNLSIKSCGVAAAEVVWEFQKNQSNFSPLQEFVVEYNTTHDPDLWMEAGRVGASARRLEFSMTPWSTYSFRARARNTLGVGEPSKRTHTLCSSARSRPYRNPSKLRTVGDKTGYLVVEWEPMGKMEHNAEGFGYKLTWQGLGDNIKNEHVIDDWTQKRYEVPVDGVYQPYQVSIMSFNKIADSLPEPVKIDGRSGEAPPNVTVANFELDPDLEVTSSKAGFRWDPVDTSPQAMNGQFQGYKIRYWKKDRFADTLHEELIVIPDNRWRRAIADDNKVHGQVSNLPSYSEIEADVVVVNTYFTSEGSNIVNFSTPEGVPSRVDYLEALFRGSSHFLLEWGPPIEKNGELTGYTLGYQQVNGLNIGEMTIARGNLPPSQMRASIDGLKSDSLYRVFVAANTRQGAGEKYFIDVRTTGDSDGVAEPSIVSVFPGEHEANITFSVKENVKGSRTGSVYYLEYRKTGKDSWDRESLGATDHFWLSLDELEPGTSYDVRVVSVPKENSKDFKASTHQRFDTMGIGAKKSSVLSAGWFIGMMVVIAILLLILIIVCIVKRNRGKEYKFPPEKDTVDAEVPGHFNEMAKSEKNGINPSASFERDPEKVPLEEETDSLEDYGDVDPTKFNEDGSFIGQYGDGKPGDAPNASAMSSIV